MSFVDAVLHAALPSRNSPPADASVLMSAEITVDATVVTLEDWVPEKM